MHILFAHNEYGVWSGEEQALQDTARLLESRGHRISWFLRSSKTIRNTRDTAAAFFSGIYSATSRRLIDRHLSTEAVDVVEVQNLYPLISPSILSACRQRRVPVVMLCPNYRLFCPSGLHLSHGETCERCLNGREYWCVLRNCENNRFKSLGYALRNASARMTRQIIDNVRVFVVLSEFQKRRFISGGIEPDRIEVLPNMAKASGTGLTPALGDLVSFVGRASPEKGIEDFVAAARILPQVPFAVAGSTSRMPELVARSPKNIRWLGFLKEPELEAFYAQSRLVVMPTRCFEGFPLALAQAMIRARPVIASHSGGLPEIVDDGKTGLLFRMRDVEDLADKIRRLYSNEALCTAMGAAGKAKAQSLYSPENVYTRLIRIYQKAGVSIAQ